MNWYKTLGLVFLLTMFSIPMAYAGELDNASGYYSMDNGGFGDISGNNNNGTNTGSVSGVGVIDTGRNYTAITDKLDFGDVYDVVNQNTMVSIGMWVKLEGATGYLFSKGNTGQFSYEFPVVGGGELIPTQHQASGSVYRAFTTSGGTLDDGDYHYIYVHMNQSKAEVWQDGISIGSSTATSGTWNLDTTAPFQLGARSFGSTSGNVGAQDEVSVYDFQLTPAQILEMYNNGTGFNPYTPVIPDPQIIFDNVTMNNIENFNNTFYNTTPITLEVNLSTIATNNNTNVTFFMYNSTGFLINTTQFMTNTLNGELDIALTTEGTFFFFLNASNNETSTLSPVVGNFTIHFDETKPSLSVNLPAQYGFYTGFNFSNFINVSDVNLVSCIITISAETPTTCTNQSYDFTFNGNHTINITATDLGGNTNSSLNNIMLINPLQTFQFNSTAGGQIFNYTFGGRSDSGTGTVQFSTYNDGLVLGSNTLLFEGLGFASTNVTFNINLTSDLNVTTIIQQSSIQVIIFNRETLAILSGVDVNLVLVPPTGGVGANVTTSTGNASFTNISFISGQYQLFATAAGFATESIVFIYDNQEILNVEIFMLNATAVTFGSIQIIVKSNDATFVEGAIVKLLEYDPATFGFFTASETTSNINGEAFLNLELGTKLYKFQATKAGISTITNQEIISVDGDSRLLVLDLITTDAPVLFENLAIDVSEINGTTVNTKDVIFQWTSIDNLVYTGTIEFWRVIGTSRIEKVFPDISISSSSAILSSGDFPINNTFTLLVVANMEIDGKTQEIDSFRHPGVGGLSQSLRFWGLNIVIPLAFYMIGAALGLALRNENLISLLKIVFVWGSLLVVPGTLAASTAAVLTVFALGELFVGYKRK